MEQKTWYRNNSTTLAKMEMELFVKAQGLTGTLICY